MARPAMIPADLFQSFSQDRWHVGEAEGGVLVYIAKQQTSPCREELMARILTKRDKPACPNCGSTAIAVVRNRNNKKKPTSPRRVSVTRWFVCVCGTKFEVTTKD
jgi:hypothetical protein